MIWSGVSVNFKLILGPLLQESPKQITNWSAVTFAWKRQKHNKCYNFLIKLKEKQLKWSKWLNQDININQTECFCFPALFECVNQQKSTFWIKDVIFFVLIFTYCNCFVPEVFKYIVLNLLFNIYLYLILLLFLFK